MVHLQLLYQARNYLFCKGETVFAKYFSVTNSYSQAVFLLLGSNTSYLKTLLDNTQLNITLQRLAHQLVENHLHFENTAIIGIQPRGVFFSDRVVQLLRQITGQQQIKYGKLDITFHRDDVHQGSIHLPEPTSIDFSIEDKKVVLIDDVLHTGRTIRAAMDALMSYGRPERVELMTLIDRHFSRELPIQPDYVGWTIDTIITQKVKVNWKENEGGDEVILIDQTKKQ